MIRKIIKIDKEKCNGCGACAAACHEGAIEMIDGKAELTREDYCDGLGIVCQHARLMRFHLRNGRRLPMMRRPYSLQKRLAVPDQTQGRLQEMQRIRMFLLPLSLSAAS